MPDAVRRPFAARSRLAIACLAALVLGCAHGASPAAPHEPPHAAQPAATPSREATSAEAAAWAGFVATLKSRGSLEPEQMRPYLPELGEPLRGALEKMARATAAKGRWNEWEVVPEIHRVGDAVHYVIDLPFGDPRTFCFTLLLEDGRWYFRHVENIFIRLDRVGALPASTFPDLPEARKAWMRTEIGVLEQARLYDFLVREKGRDFALRWFQDGNGYFLASKTWVPFVDPTRAFVLYAAWEQAHLRGNEVTLARLDDAAAVLRIRSNELLAFERTAQLKQRITLADLRALLETVWRDRAERAGWKVSFAYRDGGVVELELTRAPQ
jgi:hypothetical protein